jgi:hypothetical protein
VYLAGAGDEVHAGQVHGGQAAGAGGPGGERVVVFEVADDLMGRRGLVGEAQMEVGRWIFYSRSYRVVMVLLHVVYDSGLRGGVFARLVCHLGIAGLGDEAM